MVVQLSDDALVGKVLGGRFQVIAPLGAGGMGRVYKAIQQPLNRTIALKVLNPNYDAEKDPGFERRFFLEASMTAKLRHPNTITVYDYGRTDDGIYFIAMEYIEGETLQHALHREGKLAWARALVIAAQIARSLREAHRLGLVHRDLKPANIMLLTEGSSGDIVKVLDFGLVKNVLPEEEKPPDSSDNIELTQAGVLLGSPMYMAPEQTRSLADARSDIYSLGCVMYLAMVGRPPFTGTDALDILVKHMKEKPANPSSLVPEIPPEVSALVLKCLEKKPSHRFQNMDELLDALKAATAGSGISGLFNDPRSASSQIPRLTAPRPRPTTPPPLPPGSTPARHLAVGVPSAALPVDDRKKILTWIIALVLVGGGIGGVAAFKILTSKSKPIETSKTTVFEPVLVPVDTKPTPTSVTFQVTSDPPGATVKKNGASMGITPLTFSIERTADAAATTELRFDLEGYESATVIAQGREGTIDVHRTLRKKPVEPPPVTEGSGKRNDTKAVPKGYKDDPYQ